MQRVRVVFYVRVSTDEQALYGDSLRTQLDTLSKFAKENNYHVVDTYIDDGYTATNLNRPGLQRLLDDVRRGKIDLVLFVKIDRWSRGVRNYYKLQDVLEENKVDWKAVLEKYDTTTTAGRLQINIMLTIAENESSMTSDRIRAVFKNKIANGEVITGAKRFGYDIENKRLVINEKEKLIVQDIFNTYEKLMNLSKLVEYCQNRYDNLKYNALKRMLTNYLYIGWHVSKNYGINKNYCESIIEQDQFERIQRLIAMNAKAYKEKRPDKKDYVFSRILICNCCGNKLAGNTVGLVGSPPRNIYRCVKHRRDKSCVNNYSVTELTLEKYLLENVKKELEKYTLEIEITEQKKEIPKAKINVDKINKQLEKLLAKYMDNKINDAQYDKKYEELNRALEEAQNEIIEETKPIDKDKINDFLNMDLNNIYWSLEPLERRRLWLSIIKYIYVEKGKINIEFL